MASILLNGQSAMAPDVWDRGLHYGDGLFETIALQRGRPLCWERHLRRLRHGCRVLGLHCPDAALLHEEAQQLGAGRERAVLKLILTRGPGDRGYRAPTDARQCRLWLCSEWPSHLVAMRSDAGVPVRICTTRLATQPLLAGIKHLNRLEQVLARAEWDAPQIAEGLMLDMQGRLVEGTMSNLFWVRGTVLYTPALRHCGVAGVIRAAILECAPQLGLQPQLSTMEPEQILDVDEAFICNSLIGICSVSSVNSQKLGRGTVAQQLSQALTDKGEIMPA